MTGDDQVIPCGESCWADEGDTECVCGAGQDDDSARWPDAWVWEP